MMDSTTLPKSLHFGLTRNIQNRKGRFNPQWNTFVVSEIENGQLYLGYVDKIGTAYESDSIVSGYDAYIARPLLRDTLKEKPNMFKVKR